jgi:hypothetical protein
LPCWGTARTQGRAGRVLESVPRTGTTHPPRSSNSAGVPAVRGAAPGRPPWQPRSSRSSLYMLRRLLGTFCPCSKRAGAQADRTG